MKPAFTLIELMLTILISSTLSLLILGIIRELARIQARADSIAIQASRAEIAFNMLERDLSGIFIPEKLITDSTQLKNTTTQSDTKNIPKTDSASTSNKISEQKKQEFILEAVQKNNQLDQLSFITTNPATIFWNQTAGKPKPRYCRITYKLEADKNHKDSFLLTRQEEDLSIIKEGNVKNKTFELINGIHYFTITFYYLIKQIGTEKKDSSKPLSYQTTHEWGKTNDKNMPLLPSFISLNLRLWDNVYKTDKSYMLTIPILIQEVNEKLPTTPSPLPAKKPDEKKPNPSASLNKTPNNVLLVKAGSV